MMKPITKESMEKDRKRALKDMEELRELAKSSKSSQTHQKPHSSVRALKLGVANPSHLEDFQQLFSAAVRG